MGKINAKTTKLKRVVQPMPTDIRDLLVKESLLIAYEGRPDYQQNDYLAWISRARQSATRQKRINQMLDELSRGGIYMNMDHPASRK